MDIEFAGLSGFHRLTGRAAFVEEFLARVEEHLLGVPANTTGANMALDTNPIIFRLDQKLYLEFTHNANIVSVLTAFGLTQFAGTLPLTGPTKNRQFHTSRNCSIRWTFEH